MVEDQPGSALHLLEALNTQLVALTDLANRQVNVLDAPGANVLIDIINTQRDHLIGLIRMIARQLSNDQERFNHVLSSSRTAQQRLKDEIEELQRLNAFRALENQPIIQENKRISTKKEWRGSRSARLDVRSKSPVKRVITQSVSIDGELQELGQLQDKLRQQVIDLERMSFNQRSQDSVKRAVIGGMTFDDGIRFSGVPLQEESVIE